MKATFKQEAIITTQQGYEKGEVECQLTSDFQGKTLSIRNDDVQFTIALEPILHMLKKNKL